MSGAPTRDHCQFKTTLHYDTDTNKGKYSINGPNQNRLARDAAVQDVQQEKHQFQQAIRFHIQPEKTVFFTQVDSQMVWEL